VKLLGDALRHEVDLLENVRAALLEQRAGVASNDAGRIEDGTHRLGRSLLTIEEARRYRSDLTSVLGGGRPLKLNELELVLPQPMPADLSDARAQLRAAANGVAREVAINNLVVHRALDAGEVFIQVLFSTVAEPPAAYDGAVGAVESTRGGVLLNRRV
jgi:hypothetical protein